MGVLRREFLHGGGGWIGFLFRVELSNVLVEVVELGEECVNLMQQLRESRPENKMGYMIDCMEIN